MTIANHTHLGAGFEIAMKDMEIRGAGDVLGIKQSGKTKEIGVSLYLKLLEQKIQEIQTGVVSKPECRIDIGMSYYIDDDFFDSDMDKLHFFRQMESIETLEEIEYAYTQITQEHEEVPDQVEMFFWLLAAKVFFQKYGVLEVKKSLGNYVFTFDAQVQKDQIKAFLDMDMQRHVVLVSMTKAQVPARVFQSPEKMLQYFMGKVF